MPDFQKLDGAGRLELNWDGPPLDLYAMAILQLSVQDTVDRVGGRLLEKSGYFPYVLRRSQVERWRWRRDMLPPWEYRGGLIRATPDEIRVGSLFQQISFAVAGVIADPNVIAVLQNLASEVVWAFGSAHVKGVRTKASPGSARRPDLPDVEIGKNLLDAIDAVTSSVPRGRGTLTIRSKGATEVTVSVTIDNRED